MNYCVGTTFAHGSDTQQQTNRSFVDFSFFNDPQTEALSLTWENKAIKHEAKKISSGSAHTIPSPLCTLNNEEKKNQIPCKVHLKSAVLWVLWYWKFCFSLLEKSVENFQCWDFSLKGCFCQIGYRLVTMCSTHKLQKLSRSKFSSLEVNHFAGVLGK